MTLIDNALLKLIFYTYIPTTLILLTYKVSISFINYQLSTDTSFINYQIITRTYHISLHSKKLKKINLNYMIFILNFAFTIVFYVMG
jgi:hypothetical protein